MTVPAIAFVGKSDSGKTTLCIRVISALSGRGLRVGGVKYFGRHDFDMDIPGKDSYRFGEAGACQVAVCSDGAFAQKMPLERPMEQDEVVERMGDDLDIVVIEGHRVAGVPAMQVLRSGSARYEYALSTFDPSGTVAVITDGDEARELATAAGLPLFDLDDIDSIIAYIDLHILGDSSCS